MLNINFKKILSVIFVAVVCSGVGFSEEIESKTVKTSTTQSSSSEVYDSKVVSEKSENKEKVKHYLVLDIPVENGIKFSIEGITDTDLKYLKPEHKNKIYKSYKKAKIAYELNIADKDKLKDRITYLQDNPLVGNNIEILNKLKIAPISVSGYSVIVKESNRINGILQSEKDKLDATNPKPTDEQIISLNENIVSLEKELKTNNKLISDNPPTVDQQGKILAGMNQADKEATLEAIAEGKCDGSWNPFCTFFATQSSEQATELSFIENIKGDPSDKDYNEKLYKQFSDLYGLNCHSETSCETAVSNSVQGLSSEDAATYKQLKQTLSLTDEQVQILSELEERLMELNKDKKNLLSVIEKNKAVETNWVYSIFDAIRNPDAQAISSAKFFGYEANYDDLPNWLAEEGLAASQICIGEIDGYLDDESNTGGQTIIGADGKTLYEFDINGDNFGQGGNSQTLSVVYDLRGRRSEVMPDGKISLTVSIYYSAPVDQAVSYNVGILHNAEDFFYKKIIITNTTIPAGETNSQFEPFDIDIENFENVLDNSYFIYLKVRTESGQVLLNVNTEIFKVTNENYDDILGNGEGNLQANTNTNLELSVEQFWSDLE